jgi:polyhydroxybutyrate depolymerase
MLAILLVGLFPPPAAAGGETTVETLTVADEERTYRVHMPADGSGPYAVVLSFHGLNSNAAQQREVSQFSVLADREGFIAVYPEGNRRKWRFMGASDADVLFTQAIIEALARRAPIDRKRIYATGISNGAQMAWRLACDRPHDFAAFGFVAGGYFRVCEATDRAPVIIFHGTKDRLLPYDGRGKLMSVRNFAMSWATRPACQPVQWGQVIYRVGDATGERWTCSPGREVDLYTLDGKGHSWPGSNMPERITSRDVDATATMWAFFESHPRR